MSMQQIIEDVNASVLKKDLPDVQVGDTVNVHCRIVEGDKERIQVFQGVVILRLRNMTAIDATGLHALEQLADRLKKSGRTLLLCGAPPQPSQMLHRAEFVEHVGEDNILPNIESAIARAEALFNSQRQSA